jgi:hypothetical protein
MSAAMHHHSDIILFVICVSQTSLAGDSTVGNVPLSCSYHYAVHDTCLSEIVCLEIVSDIPQQQQECVYYRTHTKCMPAYLSLMSVNIMFMFNSLLLYQCYMSTVRPSSCHATIVQTCIPMYVCAVTSTHFSSILFFSAHSSVIVENSAHVVITFFCSE